MDNSELLVQIQQMMTGLETRMTEKMDNLETRIQESEARVKSELKAYIDHNNVVIGEMMTKELERVTQAIETQKTHLADLEKVVQKNLYDIEVLKNEVSKLKQKGA